MRLRRTLLLGLGPLISLWAMSTQALAAGCVTLNNDQATFRSAPLDRLLHPVVSFLILAAEQESAASAAAPRASHEVLGFEALHNTPLGGSLWLVYGPNRGLPLPGHIRTLQSLLRC